LRYFCACTIREWYTVEASEVLSIKKTINILYEEVKQEKSPVVIKASEDNDKDVLKIDLLFPYERMIKEDDDIAIVHFQSPIQSIIAVDALALFVDVKHDTNHSLHTMNFVVFSELVQETVVVARTRISVLTQAAYKKAFSAYINRLEMIMADFSEAQQNGISAAFISLFSTQGIKMFQKLTHGCSVHWMRSVKRVAKLVTSTEEEQTAFEHVCKKIQKLIVYNMRRNFLNHWFHFIQVLFNRPIGGPMIKY
jgi:hypothetical protein